MAHTITITITEPKDPPKDLPNPFNVKVEIGWDQKRTKTGNRYEVKCVVSAPETASYETQIEINENTTPVELELSPTMAMMNATVTAKLIEYRPLPDDRVEHDSASTGLYNIAARGPTVPPPPPQ